MVRISASIIAADFNNLQQKLQHVDEADLLHIDVMDGHFVPNITFGEDIFNTIYRETSLPLDVHLMVERPERYVGSFTKSNVEIVSIHAEACDHLYQTVQRIRNEDVAPGIAINPSTAVESVKDALKFVDHVIVMTVSPGASGQEFIPTVTDKIRRINRISDVTIAVDGGITKKNIAECVRNGADIIVSGSSIFEAHSISESINDLRRASE